MQDTSSEFNHIKVEFEKLKKSSFSLDNKFLDSFFDPIPRGIGKFVFLAFIVILITNIIAIIVLVTYYIFGPWKTKKSRPRDNSAEDWFIYAEKCMKYSFRDEIIEGYTKALELDPDNGQIQLRYNQYLVSELVHNKAPTTGQPVGMKKVKQQQDPYDTFSKLLDEWKSVHMGKLFPNPLKSSKKEKIYSLATWSAFDNKKYDDCLKYGQYSFEINEFNESKKEIEQKIELLLLLSCTKIIQKDNEQGINYLLQAMNLANLSSKNIQAMTWELAGECFHMDKRETVAEYCFLLAQQKDIHRWISAYRLFRWYSKQNDNKKSTFYKDRYVRMQKELFPL